MSHDGCHEVAWKGKAFSYLMHHPNFHSTENYGSAREAAASLMPCIPIFPFPNSVCLEYLLGTSAGHGHGHGYGRQPLPSEQTGSDVHSRAGTGTWNGPAPRGMQGATRQAASSATVSEQQPDSVRLSNGVRLPLIGLGTAAIKDPEVIKTALQLGYRHIDCAWFYGNEELPPDGKKSTATKAVLSPKCVVGQGMSEFISSREGARGELFVVSKLEDLLAVCRIRPQVNQVELHPMCAQRKLVGGLVKTNELLTHRVVARVAQEAAKTPAQVLIKWNIQRGVPVVAKTANTDRLAENLVGMYDWKLSYDQKAALDELDSGTRFIDFDWKVWGNPEDGGVAKPSNILKAL
ncbi:hypothetical protein VOLCADRAFT_94271 [Volvox carteri f. nagariensis]|uniref:NADP-dependent oxidoreductase domain-containing protein n=1 Tax=Volvox carteri f. nagariensis TaxID=3068 RepID=D8U426_VOLCA|nr:uncharacterized protein VOLCADRAFT_94271 [Volvox carteri f. nagariensis]EFJ45425.1 hypothetical protein VOLCADRAFT_94271 [Volvox carteri f. nagariensis]|eukprot:XP_002953452.1 hypothetical protein VOLCADRAFT_94271 [Volvox carteri f. nagariensis]